MFSKYAFNPSCNLICITWLETESLDVVLLVAPEESQIRGVMCRVSMAAADCACAAVFLIRSDTSASSL